MINYYLPKSAVINGTEYDIRSDYRAILDICIALSDPQLSDQERAYVALNIFYPDWEDIPPDDLEEALKYVMWFIDCGEEHDTKTKQPRLVDWEQDFTKIITPVNKVAGHDVRGDDYMHWWTFIGLYSEIDSECMFSQIVQIRAKKAKGKKLEKHEQEFYNQHRDMIDLKQKYTSAEEEWIRALTE